jgi:hypothetical protein
MNNRIKELVEQARKYARDYVKDCEVHEYYMKQNEYDVRFEEKLAELIILECAKQVKDFYQETEFTCYGAESEILSHFGME